ncbi:ABC transporter permease [Ruminococcaceae bacterium BL-4]|nr:ABC transporter permease [Ruminococcaceae bacterium BL-4]
MRNPLKKRLPRELKQNVGKYISLFLFLVLTIGFVSGFLVADNSMVKTYNESFEKYNIEDGHFTLGKKADDDLTSKLENQNISISELFYKDITLKDNNSIRIFKDRTDINKVCLMEGTIPTEDNQIAIDRLYAQNNKISVGDTLKLDNKAYTISGTIALSDYSALFKNNSDMMLDAKRFCVAIVSDKAYNSISNNSEKYCYAWRNNDQTLSKQMQSDKADDIEDLLKDSGMLTDFIKRSDNQAIQFTGDDMGSDRSMMTYLLYVVIVVLAFVFAVTTKSTVEQEASVIGTLRASGYSRGELLRHYLTLPMLVTLAAAVIGNIIGYTFMKDICAGMYYHSYSLPTYTTIWNADAFIKTTVIPCIIILLVNLLVLIRTLSLPPLQFLRHNLKHKQKKKVIKLPEWKFITRFRLRIILQNLPAYITLFFGILFASVLLLYGMIMSPLLSNFKADVQKSDIADYQYILKAPSETNYADAEKYCVTSLNIKNDGEKITVYGIADHSTYLSNLSLPQKSGDVIVSDGYLEKYGLKVGDSITLQKEYENKSYTFTIAGHYNYPAALTVFMSQDTFNDTFGYDADYFSGYFSNKKLTDINDAYIASVITSDDLTVVADQLDDSMGFMFPMLCGFSAILYMLLMYLLAKLIVEKNAQAISMVKILGYNNKEAGKLYNTATTIVVGLSLIISLPLSCLIMKELYYIFMKKINGWLTFYIAPWIHPAMLGIGVVCYLLVFLIQMKKVRKIPMAQALKNME